MWNKSSHWSPNITQTHTHTHKKKRRKNNGNNEYSKPLSHEVPFHAKFLWVSFPDSFHKTAYRVVPQSKSLSRSSSSAKPAKTSVGNPKSSDDFPVSWPFLPSSYRWWKKSCTTQHVWNPVKNRIFSISTGAGFLPSTVQWKIGVSPIG